MNRLHALAGRILLKVIVFGALGAAGVAWAEADRGGALAVSRQAGGTSGGVVEVRINGAVWGVLYEGDRVSQKLTPGRYRVVARLLNREGGSVVYGVPPLEQQVSVAAGSLREITLSLVPEMLGPVLKASLAP